MQIKSVAVLGAGAVGSYVIWGLSSRKDIRLAVIAEGPRAERLKQQGITINGTTYRPQVWTPQEANGVDLLVVALKYGALMRMGQELGIPTPYNEYTYHMIKALEEKNDGLFDYAAKASDLTCAK